MGSSEPDSRRLAWKQYLAEPTVENRQRVAEHYYGLVRYVITPLIRRLPPSVEYDELVSYGTMGLLQAVDRFEPPDNEEELQRAFVAYVIQRIRGAIYDGLRALDPLPWRMRSAASDIASVRDGLAAELEREPTAEEVAEAAGVSLLEMRTLTTAASAAWESQEDDLSVEVDSSDRVMAEVFLARLRSLSQRDKALLAAIYCHGMTYTDVGEVIGRGVSRVMVVHQGVLRSLMA